MQKLTEQERIEKLEQAFQIAFGPGSNLNQQLEEVATTVQQLHTQIARVDLATRLSETWLPRWLADAIAACVPEMFLPNLRLVILPTVEVDFAEVDEVDEVDESEVLD